MIISVKEKKIEIIFRKVVSGIHTDNNKQQATINNKMESLINKTINRLEKWNTSYETTKGFWERCVFQVRTINDEDNLEIEDIDNVFDLSLEQAVRLYYHIKEGIDNGNERNLTQLYITKTPKLSQDDWEEMYENDDYPETEEILSIGVLVDELVSVIKLTIEKIKKLNLENVEEYNLMLDIYEKIYEKLQKINESS